MCLPSLPFGYQSLTQSRVGQTKLLDIVSDMRDMNAQLGRSSLVAVFQVETGHLSFRWRFSE